VSGGDQLRFDHADLDRGDLERLSRLPAWERASVYAAFDLDLAERQMIELAVRALIRASYQREHGGRGRVA